RTSDTLPQATQPGVISPRLAFDHWASLFSQSHLVALSAASMVDLMALFLHNPKMPSLVRTLQRDWPAKPRHPTSIGSQRVIQPCLLHSSVNSWYLARLRS